MIRVRVLVIAICLTLIVGSGAWYAINAASGLSDAGPVQLPHSPTTPAGILTVMPSKHATTTNIPFTAVFLSCQELNDHGPFGLIGRELVRQAILITARDEFAADTRDEALGEAPLAENSHQYALQMRAFGRLQIILTSLDTPGVPSLKAEMGYPKPGISTDVRVEDYLALISALASCEKRELAAALRMDGLTSRAVAQTTPVIIPPSIEEDLSAMTIFRQYSALRALHALAKEHGQQPAVSGLLARGYANASLLTHHLWSSMSRVFAARALLYAEQTVRDLHSSAWSLRQRGYVRILVGFVNLGVADLDAADKATPDVDLDSTTWVPLLRSFSAFDHLALIPGDGNNDSELAHVLCLLVVSHARDWGLVYSIGYRTLAHAQTCLRAIDIECENGGVSNLHRMTDYAPEAMETILRDQIGRMPELPSNAASVIAGGVKLDRRAKVIRALQTAGTTPCGEPSWSALGQIVADETLLQAFRRLDFMVDHWGVQASEGIEQYASAIAEHPYRNLVLSYAIDATQDPQRVKEMLAQVHYRDMRPDMYTALRRRQIVDHAGFCAIWDPGLNRSDPTLWDLAWRSTMKDVPNAVQAKRIRSVARHSPVAAIMTISDEKADISTIGDAYRREFPHHPSVRRALADALMAKKQWHAAEADLEAEVTEAPEKDAFVKLAGCRYEQGDEAGWVATLDRYLKTDEVGGLEHDDVRVKLAHYYMGKGEYDLAWPYAELAAKSWAAWAIECAASCSEGRGDLDAANRLWQRNAERYSDESILWFGFTIRTSYGDAQSAREAVDRHADSLSDSADAGDLLTAALVAECEGRHQRSRALCECSLEHEVNPFTGLLLVLLDREAGDIPTARKVLSKVCKEGRTYQYDGEVSKDLVAFADLFAGALNKDPIERLDLDKLRHALEVCDTSVSQDVNLAYFIGRALDDEARPEDAREFYLHAVQTLTTQKFAHVLACKRIRELGEDPWKIHKEALKKTTHDHPHHVTPIPDGPPKLP